MKSYTDLEQSKKLAKILPIESADMCFNTHGSMPPLMTPYTRFKEFFNMGATPSFLIPCWSLVALLEVIRVECRMEKTPLDQSGEFTYSMVDDYNSIRTFEWGNPIDACVEMIYKLKKNNLL